MEFDRHRLATVIRMFLHLICPVGSSSLPGFGTQRRRYEPVLFCLSAMLNTNRRTCQQTFKKL